MSAAEVPLPADLALDEPPIPDEDFAEYLDLGPADPEALTAPQDYTDEAVRRSRVHAWQVTDLGSAEWAMRTLATAQAEVDALAAQRDAWIEKIGGWFTQAARRPAGTVAYMTSRLEDYGVRCRETNPKVATIPLPAGVIRTTDRRPAAEVADDAAVAAYVETMLGEPQRALDDDESVRWKAWRDAWAALCAEAAEPVVLVKRDPKVYVGPLRKLISLGEVQTAHRVTVVLSCDHEWSYVTNDEGADAPVVGEFLTCTLCEPDPIDGALRWPVRHVEVVPEVEQAVLGPDGRPVPGMVVRPGEITAKASPA